MRSLSLFFSLLQIYTINGRNLINAKPVINHRCITADASTFQQIAYVQRNKYYITVIYCLKISFSIDRTVRNSQDVIISISTVATQTVKNNSKSRRDANDWRVKVHVALRKMHYESLQRQIRFIGVTNDAKRTEGYYRLHGFPQISRHSG